MKKWILILPAILLLAALALTAQAEVALDAEHFSDEVFRNYLTAYDKDGNSVLSDEEIKSITYVSLWTTNGDISSLKGIENLTSISYLDVHGKKTLTSIDLSSLSQLTEFNCQLCGLTALDVSHNTALKILDCEANQLTSLDVSMLENLEKLACRGNQLTSLKLGSLSKLTSLSFYSNWQLSALDVTGCPALMEIIGGSTSLAALDLSKCTQLKKLDIGSNQGKMTALDLHNNILLEDLDVSYLQLGKLDVSSFMFLRTLDCKGCGLTELLLPAGIQEVECESNNLAHLDVTGCPNLTKLYCSMNPFSSLNIGQNAKLKKLDCTYCHSLLYLDISNNPEMTELKLQGCALVCMDISGTNNLATSYGVFYCDYNERKVAFENGSFDPNTLTGFNPANAHDFEGGTMEGGVFRLNKDSSQIQYTYECGGGKNAVFTLIAAAEPAPAKKMGDVNGDNEINIMDVIRLLKSVSGWTVEIDEEAADVNGDGKTNIMDVIRLLKYVSGWNVELAA